MSSDKVNYKVNIDEVIDRLKTYLKIDKDNKLANKLGISPQDFINRRKKGTLLSYIFQFAVNHKINLQWLIYGSTQDKEIESLRDIQMPASEELDIYVLLKKAGEVLESPGIYRTALASNINAFHHSIKMSQDLADMKARMDTLEEFEAQTKIKFDELAQLIKGLQEENRILKQLRSSEEDSPIIDASSHTTRPSSRKTE